MNRALLAAAAPVITRRGGASGERKGLASLFRASESARRDGHTLQHTTLLVIQVKVVFTISMICVQYIRVLWYIWERAGSIKIQLTISL